MGLLNWLRNNGFKSIIDPEESLINDEDITEEEEKAIIQKLKDSIQNIKYEDIRRQNLGGINVVTHEIHDSWCYNIPGAFITPTFISIDYRQLSLYDKELYKMIEDKYKILDRENSILRQKHYNKIIRKNFGL